MIEYIKGLSMKDLQKLCIAFAQNATRLAPDGDIGFRKHEELPWDENPPKEGFYCTHSGEPLIGE